MKKLSLLLILGLFVNAYAVNEIPITKYEDPKLGIDYPTNLAGMKPQGMHEYENPALGYSLGYIGNNLTKADIYVYDGGLKNIPSGCDNKIVKSEIANIGKMFKTLEERGNYLNVKKLSSGIRPKKDAIQFAWNKYQFSYAPRSPEDKITYTGDRLSETFITGFKGQLIKIRFTYKKSNALEGDKTSKLLIKEIIKALKSAANPKKDEKRAFTINVDSSLSEQLMTPWLSYLLARQEYIMKHKSEYLLSETVYPKFQDELAGRNFLAIIWGSMKKKDAKLKDKYLDELDLVVKAGFLKEYVWSFLKRDSWVKPEKLRLDKFEKWSKENLKNHKVETYGSIAAGTQPKKQD